MKPWLLALLLAAPAAAPAADGRFDGLTKAVESHFGVRRTRIPLLGVANFFVKVTRPHGAKGFKLAVFEDLRRRADTADLDAFMAETVKGSPIVRVCARGREATYVYAEPNGRNVKLLIAEFERHEATIIEAKVDGKTLAEWLTEPDRMSHYARGDWDIDWD